MSSQSDQKEPQYTISRAAKLLEVSVHTLRMYEREGLFIPFKKKTNQRLYSKNDLERISNLRNVINDKKISINGIKTIYSLIPCWEIIKCAAVDRSICNAYKSEAQVCWVNKKAESPCNTQDCRECSVYTDFFACGKIKELLKVLFTEKAVTK